MFKQEKLLSKTSVSSVPYPQDQMLGNGHIHIATHNWKQKEKHKDI